MPKTNEITNPDGIGKRTEFQNGPIYWSPQGGAHPVANHFLAAWARHGYENSYIGYPTTDEIVNADGIGRRQHFTGSTIYWNLNEAYSVGGAISDKWHTLGAESADGLLGYPTSDERVLPDGQGRMNRFERGTIYWHPTTGAHEVYGDILDEWAMSGYETGWLGYPTSSREIKAGQEYEQHFQGGSLLGSDTGENYATDTMLRQIYHNRVRPCMEYRKNFEKANNIHLFDGPVDEGYVFLTCADLRNHIAPEHMDDGDPSENEWVMFYNCVQSTFRNGKNFTPAQQGMWGYEAWALGTYRARVVVDGNQIYTAFTNQHEGGDWVRCPVEILGPTRNPF